MHRVRIAAAQSTSIAGDVAANMAIHCRFVAAAAKAKVDLLVFPELSLTGYELPLLASYVLGPEDPILAPLVELVNLTGVTVILGTPISNGPGKPHIGAITLSPRDKPSVYRKQYLHAGEEQFAAPGDLLATAHAVGNTQYALAICADITHAQHAQAAANTGVSLYLTSVLVSEAGYTKDAGYLQSYAKQHDLGVLMANHAAPTGGYVVAGKSAFWTPGGALLVQAPGAGNCLVVAASNADGWSGEVLDVPLG